MQQNQLGKSTEGRLEQCELFYEVEELVVDAETDEGVISFTPKKAVDKFSSKELPRKVIVHDISDEEKALGYCAEELHRIGEDKSEKFQFNLAQWKLLSLVPPNMHAIPVIKTAAATR